MLNICNQTIGAECMDSFSTVIPRRPMKLCLIHRQPAAQNDYLNARRISISASCANDLEHTIGRTFLMGTKAGKRPTRGLPFAFSAALTILPPAPGWAATGALPWDQTLIALQDILIGPVAHAAITLAFVGAGILYALGGHEQQARRLAASGIGGCLALAAIRLLNFVSL
jgi:type IV secretory pathway VirB2 component (pilin)